MIDRGERPSSDGAGDQHEGQILALIGRGYRFRQIAEALSINEEALNDHVAGIRDRLKARTSRELYEFAATHPRAFIRSTTSWLSACEAPAPAWGQVERSGSTGLPCAGEEQESR